MANIDSFFNKTSFKITKVTPEFVILKDIEFTYDFHITDIVGYRDVASVSSTFYIKSGRNETALSDASVWVAPIVQPDPIDPEVADPMWPVNIWSMTATIVDATWDGKAELFMKVVMVDSNGALQVDAITLNKGD